MTEGLKKDYIQKISTQGGGGFTLVELLVGTLVTSLMVAAGLKLSQVVINNNKQNERNSQAIQLADTAIDQIQQEIRNGEQLIDLESGLPTGCNGYKQGGIQFLFAVDIPDQAMSLASYDISKGKPDLKTVKCPIIYGTKTVGNEIELYRVGTDIDKSGYYDSTKTSTTPVLKGISKQTNRSLQCPSAKWKHIKRGGIEVCIDQRLKRMAKLTLTVNNGRDLPGIISEGSTAQRQGSAMTEIMSQEDIPSTGGSGDKCKSGSGCNFAGQSITCDKTSFMIDVSGSMQSGGSYTRGWVYYQWNGKTYRYWGNKYVPTPNARMERAKRELLRAIDSCSDDAEINVTAFSSNGWSTEKTAFATPQKLSANNRNKLKTLINGLYPEGGTDPWRFTHKMMADQNVKEIVLLSDGGTSTSGRNYNIGGKTYNGSYAQSYQNYNSQYRKTNPIKIKTISFGSSTYCNPGQWMGDLARNNGGSCVVAK